MNRGIRLLLLTLFVTTSCKEVGLGQDKGTPTYGDAFWQHWGDGRAEVAAYDLTMPRYGQPRRGTAVAIFVTESFSNRQRVKADSPSQNDVFPVFKLNLIEDFQTGIYDYNTMTSVFVGLEAANGRPAGCTTKISHSSQEWCGHIYQQLLFDGRKVRHQLHSYFDGEADRNEALSYPKDGVPADGLLLWARGLAGPALQPGERIEIEMLMSLQDARFLHQRLAWAAATLTRARGATEVTVPAGTFMAEVLTVDATRGPDWKITVEQARPRRVLKWERSDGQTAELLGVKRMQYWALNANGKEALLAELGLPVPD